MDKIITKYFIGGYSMFLDKKPIIIISLVIILILSLVSLLNAFRSSCLVLKDKCKQYNSELLEMMN